MSTIHDAGIPVHQIDPPEDLRYYGDIDEPWYSTYGGDPFDGIDEAWYWYYDGGYDGSGQMLLRRGREFALHDMGHCSCFGPLEDLQADRLTWYPSRADLMKHLSDDLMKHVEPLLNAAAGAGFTTQEEK